MWLLNDNLSFKGLLTLIPQDRLKPNYRSGARDLRKTRPLSKGTEVYDTNPLIWPVNEPMPRVDALIQCAGEAKYVNDLPTQPREVYCAFVTSDICIGEIESIDPTPALVRFIYINDFIVFEYFTKARNIITFICNTLYDFFAETTWCNSFHFSKRYSR